MTLCLFHPSLNRSVARDQVPRQMQDSSSSVAGQQDKYVALVSGLGLGRPETDMLKVREVHFRWL